jgi:hypothetical protein
VPCFEIQLIQTSYNPYSQNVILLAIAGSLNNFSSGTLLNVNGAFSKAQCSDPCQYYAYGTVDTNVAEPASVVLLGCGLVLLLGIARRKLHT